MDQAKTPTPNNPPPPEPSVIKRFTRKICLVCDKEFPGDLNNCPDDKTALVPLKEQSMVGETIAGTYFLEKEIGSGGMGKVYKARHKRMERVIAIKILNSELAQDPNSRKRFQQEAQAASHLSHPNIIVVHDCGVTEEEIPIPYIVMEYLEGYSWQDSIRGQGNIDPVRLFRYFSQAADALDHAHRQGILHRDLKPSNIFVVTSEVEPDFVKVLDFGLAKLMPWSGKESQHLTKTGEVFGSPIYMSPEQCMGKKLTIHSDIYSMGITLYEALVGKPPFKGSNTIQTATKHMSEPPPPMSYFRPDLKIPPQLESIVLRALRKDPEERYETMGEFKEAYEFAIAGLEEAAPAQIGGATVSLQAMPAAAPPPEMAHSSSAIRPQSRVMSSLSAQVPAVAPEPEGLSKKVIAAIVGGLVLVGIGAGGAAYFLQSNSTPAPAAAEAQISGQMLHVGKDPTKPENLMFTVRDVKDGKIKHLTGLMETFKTYLKKVHPGDIVEFKLLPDAPGQIAYMKAPGSEDSPIFQAGEQLRTAFNLMSDERGQWGVDSRNMLAPTLRQKDAKELNAYFHVPDLKPAFADPQQPPPEADNASLMIMNALEQNPNIFQADVSALKFVGDQGAIVFLLDKSHFYQTEKGYEKITLVKDTTLDKWLIESAVDVDPKEWNAI